MVGLRILAGSPPRNKGRPLIVRFFLFSPVGPYGLRKNVGARHAVPHLREGTTSVVPLKRANSWALAPEVSLLSTGPIYEIASSAFQTIGKSECR
jgi:hypothetical protein